MLPKNLPHKYHNLQVCKIAEKLSDAIREQSGWLGEKFIRKLTVIYWEIHRSLEVLQSTEHITKDVIEEQGTKLFKTLDAKIRIAYDQYFQDIKNLSNISAFKREKVEKMARPHNSE
ncbi:hypothetical protein ECE50_017535 [Chitinophaga sp. Mgbs1]|uniref:Uncharacterized protein n=1 Tax=Chitinophaga solisilvae TaxID=1233460 RepID=A0A433W8J1_9BACT|nr:hypothetical protein [Chitinophaga solisilvae]